MLVKEGLVKAGEFVDKYLERNSLQITSEDELLAICKVACNNDKDLACMLVEGILSTGRDGAFLVEEGNALEDRIVVCVNRSQMGWCCQGALRVKTLD